MKKNYKKFDYYKKTLLIFILIFFILIISIKFFINSVKSEIKIIVNSKQFENYVSEQINSKIDAFANKPMTKTEHEFYKDNFKKIYIKFKPIFDEIQKEIK